MLPPCSAAICSLATPCPYRECRLDNIYIGHELQCAEVRNLFLVESRRILHRLQGIYFT
jgi:hypothetical protein